MKKYIDKDYTDEEVAILLYNAHDKKEFVSNFGYKDCRTAKKICDRHGLNIDDLGKDNKNKLGRLLKNGDRFDFLTVIDANCTKLGKKPETASLCQCKCGEKLYVKNDFLKRGHTTSCGCKSGHNKQNLIKEGDIFGELTVIQANIKLTDHGDQTSLCRCSCGKEITVINNALRRGQCSCGCVLSKGERKINQILSEVEIPFKTQFTFPDLKGDFKPLKFDFAIFDKNDTLLCLIEYQGIQHYQKQQSGFGGKTIEYDHLKREYCENHHIPLIEIPYYDYNSLSKEHLEVLINNVK